MVPPMKKHAKRVDTFPSVDIADLSSPTKLATTRQSTTELHSTSAIPNESNNNNNIMPPPMTPRVTNALANTIGPASMVGGTAVIYTSLLQHPSSTLTHLSFLFMMLLAVQYALQPRLSKRYISPHVNKQSVALVEEVVKTGMAAAIFATKPKDVVQASLQDWSISSSMAVAGLPAMLYAVQGVFQYVSHQHLDPVTFNGLTQTKTLSAALCCWLIMGRIQSPMQILALSILFGSALVFQGYVRIGGIRRQASQQQQHQQLQQPTPVPAESAMNAQRHENWLWKGVIPCLGAAFLSGLAGALSQKGLQLTGISGRDPFLYTVEISFFSALALLFNMMRNNAGVDWQKQRAYWNWKTLIPIVVKAAGGVVTALVHKYAGSVAKGFALMFGLVLSSTLQLTLTEETLQPHQVLGTLMIMLSTWLHFTHPPV